MSHQKLTRNFPTENLPVHRHSGGARRNGYLKPARSQPLTER
jgi:hypothetical protein